MKILVDGRPLHDPHPGGVTRVTDGLLRSLPQQSTDSEYLIGTTGARDPLTSVPFTSHVHKRIPNKLWSAGCLLGIHAFDHLAPQADALFLPNIGFLGLINKPYTLLVHDVASWIEPRWFSPRARLWHIITRSRETIQRAHHIVCLSARTAYDVERILGVPASRISVIQAGLHPEDLLPATIPLSPSLAGRRFVLAFGANDPRKNIGCARVAMRALQSLPAYTDMQLVLANGATSRAELRTLYTHAACVLYPSWYEGFGLPLHEASVFGTPCLSSTAGALPETAPPGTLFVPPQKPHLWTEALALILSSPEHYRTTRVLNDWTQGAQQLAKILKAL